MPTADAVAGSLSELRQLLQERGFPAATEAVLFGGFPDDNDMLLAFANQRHVPQAITYSSDNIREAQVHRLIAELAPRLARLQTKWLGPRMFILYKLR